MSIRPIVSGTLWKFITHPSRFWLNVAIFLHWWRRWKKPKPGRVNEIFHSICLVKLLTATTVTSRTTMKKTSTTWKSNSQNLLSNIVSLWIIKRFLFSWNIPFSFSPFFFHFIFVFHRFFSLWNWLKFNIKYPFDVYRVAKVGFSFPSPKW